MPMGFVIEGLFAAGLVAAILWLLSLRGSVASDRKAARAERRRAEEEQEREAREARLYRPGEPLYCLGCETTFAGPLMAMGCPHCHLSALVVTQADYRAGQQAAPSRVARLGPQQSEEE